MYSMQSMFSNSITCQPIKYAPQQVRPDYGNNGKQRPDPQVVGQRNLQAKERKYHHLSCYSHGVTH